MREREAGKLGAVFFVSFALIALQLFYMRALSVTKYHHFSYLVISTALLGFGAGGSFLSIYMPKIKLYYSFWSRWLLCLFTLSIPLSYGTAQLLPLDIHYLFYSGSQLALLLLYNFLIFIPFFFGALFIGSALSYFTGDIPVLYGVNLFGSGIGGVGALGIMMVVAPEFVPLASAGLALAAQMSWFFSDTSGRNKSLSRPLVPLLLGALVCGGILFFPWHGKIDQYKDLAHLQRLESQNSAEHILSGYDARGRIDLYQAPSLHRTMYAGTSAPEAPPPQSAVLFNGEAVGTLFNIKKSSQAEIMDFTPQSLSYRLLLSENKASHSGGKTKVILLGEVGGTNIWLARRFSADRIEVVQENPIFLRTLSKEMLQDGGAVFSLPGVHTWNRNPRLFLESAQSGNNQTEEKYDLIQIASSEGMPSASGGLQSLHENYLLTREGIAACIQLLSEYGYLSVTRGIQTPPRDNIKLFALFVAALRQAGFEDPSVHLLQARNYLAVSTILSARPLSAVTITAFRRSCDQLNMDAEYYPGITPGETPQRNILPGPPDSPSSYYQYAAQRILSDDPETFFASWVYRVKAPRDDQPYFHNFFKWSSLKTFLESYGHTFLRKIEHGYAVLALTLTQIILAAFILILLPLLVGKKQLPAVRGAGTRGYRLPALLHFASIGFGFMFLEMVMIQKFSYSLGDPLYSVAAVITSILLFAGLGSSWQKKLRLPAPQRVRRAAVVVGSLAIAYALFLDGLVDTWVGFPLPIRFVCALAVLAPLTFFMGWMLPSGMACLEGQASDLVPWAWGINGFTSVAAGPLSVLLSMEIGFSWVIVCAAGCYAAAGGSSFLWPGLR